MSVTSPVTGRVTSPVVSRVTDGRRRRGGVVFSPLSLFASGEVGAWYDPSDLSTLFQDDAGLTPVTAAGQVVGRMLDKSGNGFHATQASTDSKPLYEVADGLAHLKFDGIDDLLVLPNIPFSGDTGIEVFGGVDTTSLQTGSRALLGRSSSSLAVTFAPYLGESSIYSPAVFDNGSFRARNTTARGKYVGEWRTSLISTGTRRALTRVNGNEVTQDYARGLASGEILISITVSVSSQNALFSLHGLIIRCDVTMTTEQRDQVENYLAIKTGVTL